MTKRVTIHFRQQDPQHFTEPTVLTTDGMAAGYHVHTDEKGQNPVGYRVYAGHETVLVPFESVLYIHLETSVELAPPAG